MAGESDVSGLACRIGHGKGLAKFELSFSLRPDSQGNSEE
jgi:hypothetical protein